VLRLLGNSFLTLWLAFLAAVAVESHRPATLDGVEGLTLPKANTTAPDLLDRMEQAVWHRNQPLEITESDINRYLATAISGSQKGISSSLASFDRVAVNLHPARKDHPQSCVVWFRWTSLGMPCTASLEFTLKREHNNYVIEPVRGTFGHLPVFRGALAVLIPGCRSLGAAFEEEIHALFQMNQITFMENKVVLEPRFDVSR
jgi:hypothetical protein